MKNFTSIINTVFVILGIFFIAYYLCVRTAGYNPSILFIWLILGTTFFVKGLWCIKRVKLERGWLRAIHIIFNATAIIFIISFILFTAGILSSMNRTPGDKLDYIIVLGAAVYGDKPSPTLKARIDAAYNYLVNNESTQAIASGGQGSNEVISEGKCIAQELISMGISESRILIESKSTTTVENLKYSLMLIDARERTVGIVTSNFHVFRSKIMLQQYIDNGVEGISAEFSGITFLHYMLREYIAFHIDLILGNIY